MMHVDESGDFCAIRFNDNTVDNTIDKFKVHV